MMAADEVVPGIHGLFNDRRVPMGHEFAEPHGSAYGTNHPVDIALGRARRLRNFHASASGKISTSDALHQASEVINAGAQASRGEM